MADFRRFYRSSSGKSVEDGSERNFTPTAKTDSNGQFEIRGVGQDRIVWLWVRGHPDYAPEIFLVVTRDHVSLTPQNDQLPPLHSASFEHTLTPAKPIHGMVRTRDTGAPPTWGKSYGDRWSHRHER